VYENKYSVIPSRRFGWRFAALFLSLLLCGNCPAEGVSPFSATYKVRYGLLSGEMTLELRRKDDSAYVYHTSLRPRGLVSLFRSGSIDETTVMEITGDTLRPVDYRSIDTIARPPRKSRYYFDSPAGRVTGSYKDREIDEPMRPGGQNRISAHIAVMLALNAGHDPSVFAVFDRARWNEFDFEVFSKQTASTALGDYDTVEFRYTSADKGRNKSWSLHCASALDYVPVLIEYREDGKLKSRAQLTEFHRIDGAS